MRLGKVVAEVFGAPGTGFAVCWLLPGPAVSPQMETKSISLSSIAVEHESLYCQQFECDITVF